MFDKLPISSKTEKILTKSLDEEISVEEANHLMNIKIMINMKINLKYLLTNLTLLEMGLN